MIPVRQSSLSGSQGSPGPQDVTVLGGTPNPLFP